MCFTAGTTIAFFAHANRIYVRKVFVDLLHLIVERIPTLKDNRDRAITVSGTPGMGKTYFMGFVWNELRKKNDVVVELVDGSMYISRNNGPPTMLREGREILTSERGRHLIYLCDPGNFPPSPTHALTILFCSPSIKHKGAFSRSNIMNLCMPPWKQEELHECMSLLYIPAMGFFDERFERWGGSIRSMTNWQPWLEVERERLLQEFVTKDTLIDLVNEISGDYLSASFEQYQWLVHRMTDTGETITKIDFPSQYVKGVLAEAIRNLRTDWKTSSNSILLGNLYEFHVFQRLLQISDTNDDLAKFNIPAIKKHYFYSNQDVFQHPEASTLYVPIESNKGGCDYVMPSYLFQVTRNKKHDVKALEMLSSQFPSVVEWTIVFVIPSCNLEKFKMDGVRKCPWSYWKLPFDFS